MSDTPRTDEAYFKPHATMYDLAGEMKLIERELNAANSIIRQQQLLDEANLRLQDRIKRLEEAGDKMETRLHLRKNISDQFVYKGDAESVENWNQAKEAKP